MLRKNRKQYCTVCLRDTNFEHVLTHWDNNYYIDKKLYILASCTDCGLAMVINQPTMSAIASYYPKTYYAYSAGGNILFRLKNASIHAAKFLPRFLGRRTLLTSLFVFPKDGQNTVLDVGCGDGSALIELGKLGFSELIGTEIDDVIRDKTTQHIRIYKQGDLTKLKLRARCVDVIRISHVLEHVHNPRETLVKSCVMLKDDGSILIGVPNYSSLCSRISGRYYTGLQLPTHLYHFNKQSLSRLLNSTGFEVRQMRTVGYSGFASSIKTLLRDRYSIIMPNSLFYILLFSLIPIEIILNILGQGFMINVEAVKKAEQA